MYIYTLMPSGNSGKGDGMLFGNSGKGGGMLSGNSGKGGGTYSASCRMDEKKLLMGCIS